MARFSPNVVPLQKTIASVMFVHAKLLGILVEATSRKRINKKDFKNQQSCTVFRDYLIHFVQQMHKNNCNLTFHN